ncbi:MAG: hypothetical protein R2724_25280 [Bryobacterales bacterium]
MEKAVTRLSTELLRAELDLDHATQTRTADGLLLTSQAGPARLAVALLFAVPALYLAASAWKAPTLWPFAFVICPILALFALTFCCARFEKAFGTDGLARSSFAVLGYRIEHTDSALPGANVQIESDWELDPPSWRYRVHVDGLDGFTLVSRHYETGLSAATDLAGVLRRDLRDETTPRSRESDD